MIETEKSIDIDVDSDDDDDDDDDDGDYSSTISCAFLSNKSRR